MNKTVKKILVVLPVLILTFLFLKANYRDEYRHAGAKRLFLFLLSILILYTWILYFVAKRTVLQAEQIAPLHEERVRRPP